MTNEHLNGPQKPEPPQASAETPPAQGILLQKRDGTALTLTEQNIHEVDGITREIRAQNELELLKNNLGWTNSQFQEFVGESGHKPYQSDFVLFGKDKAGRETAIQIGSLLVRQWKEKIASAENADVAKDRLREFTNAAIGFFHNKEICDADDHLNGINPDDRHEGVKEWTPDMVQLFDDQTRKVASESGESYDALRQHVDAATEGGNFQTILPFLQTHGGSDSLRQALQGILTKRMQDQRFAREKVRAVWNQVQFLNKIGMRVATYYAINGYENIETIQEPFLGYLEDPTRVSEVFGLLEKETEETYRKYQSDKQAINYYAILGEQTKTASTTVETTDEQHAKREDALKRVFKCFPPEFAEELEKNTQFFWLTGKGVSMRAVAFSYPTEGGGSVQVSVIDPRDSKKRLEEFVIPHELGHNIHKLALKELDPDAYSQVSTNIREDVAETVQTGVAANLAPSDTQKQASPSVLAGKILMRRQAPRGLLAVDTRLEIEKRLDEKDYDPTEDEIQELAEKQQQKFDDWNRRGVPIDYPNHGIAGALTIFPDDGVRYLWSTITGQSSASGKKPDNMVHTVMVDRFQENWVGNPNAIDFLNRLLAEQAKTGRTDIQDLASSLPPAEKNEGLVS